MIQNLSTMFFGKMSTKSVLKDRDYSNDIEVEAIDKSRIKFQFRM